MVGGTFPCSLKRFYESFRLAEKSLHRGAKLLIADCRLRALFLGLLFGCFDLDTGVLGLTLIHKILSVGFVFCQSFELISTKIFVRFLACRKKVWKPYPKRHRSVHVQRTAWKKGERKLYHLGCNLHVNRVLFWKKGSFKLSKKKIADPDIRQCNVVVVRKRQKKK